MHGHLKTVRDSCKNERKKQLGIFKYLSFTITPDARSDTAIKKRITLSKDTFTKMKSIFTSEISEFTPKSTL